MSAPWIEFAIHMGHGICNTGNHTGIMYGTMNQSEVPPSWILVGVSGDIDKDRICLTEAFELKRPKKELV